MVGEFDGESDSRIDRRAYLGLAGASMLAPLSTTAGAERTGNGAGNRAPVTDSGPMAVGYYPFWADSEPASLPYETLTHVLFAFVYVQPDGRVTVEYGREKLEAFRAIRDQHPDTRFVLSVGPPSEPSRFASAAATQERRERFAKTTADLLETYDFDGIDVDWEYPGQGGDEEYRHFTKLLGTTRQHLDERSDPDGQGYSLSFATTPAKWQAQQLELEQLEPFVDFLNLMTYTMTGPWSETTGLNAPLYGPDRLSIDGLIAWWEDQPIPMDKLALGLPFYGKYFTDVPATNGGLDQEFDGAGSYSYSWIRNLPEDYAYTWRDTNAVPTLYSDQRREFVTFDNPRSIRTKTRWALDQELGGVMIWHLDQDHEGELIGAVAESLPKGPPPVVGSDPPTDPDGDGRYEDVDGNGRMEWSDGVTFANHVDSAAVQNNLEAFDYTGDGELDLADIFALYWEV